MASRLNLIKARQAKKEKEEQRILELQKIVAEQKEATLPTQEKIIEKKQETVIELSKLPIIKEPEPVVEEKIPTPPMEEEKKDVVIQIEEPTPPKKITLKDLFIIPPGFFDRPNQSEEDMKGVTIQNVEKKRPKFDLSTTKKRVEKRKREETSEDEDEKNETSSSESDDEEEQRRRRRHKKRRREGGNQVTLPTVVPKPKGWMDTIGGVYAKVNPYFALDWSSVRNNVLLGFGSILVIAVRGAAQKHLAGGPIVGTPHQDHPVRVDNIQTANQAMPISLSPLQTGLMDYSSYSK